MWDLESERIKKKYESYEIMEKIKYLLKLIFLMQKFPATTFVQY